MLGFGEVELSHDSLIEDTKVFLDKQLNYC